mgnify:CR=1 FL=1
MKMRILKLLIFLSAIISCNRVNNDIINNEYKIQSLVWTQNAAEYRALCYQAFNAAKMNLDAFFFFKNKSRIFISFFWNITV